VLEDIASGAFARSFQTEAESGYPMLALARALMRGGSPMTQAEARLRDATGLPDPS
jgi:ketol-acid reductoisomerase